MFRRRQPLTLSQKIRRALWPQRGWKRMGLYYWRRLIRLPSSPVAIASGFGIGAGLSFTPFIGFHLFGALALSWLTRSNLFAAAVGVLIIGNYFTFIPIMLLDYKVGLAVLEALGHTLLTPPDHVTLSYMIEQPIAFTRELFAKPADIMPLFGPLLIGSAVMGLAIYALSLSLIRPAIARWRNMRKARLLARRQSHPVAVG